MIGTRRQSRELALQVLFQKEFAAAEGGGNIEDFRRSFDATDEVWEYTLSLLRGVEEHLAAIDALLQSQSAHWSLKRMALVDLNVMRIAAYELRFASEPLPPAVVINEAIEISRKFGSVDSPAFVNGILDQIVKQ